MSSGGVENASWRPRDAVSVLQLSFLAMWPSYSAVFSVLTRNMWANLFYKTLCIYIVHSFI